MFLSCRKRCSVSICMSVVHNPPQAKVLQSSYLIWTHLAFARTFSEYVFFHLSDESPTLPPCRLVPAFRRNKRFVLICIVAHNPPQQVKALLNAAALSTYFFPFERSTEQLYHLNAFGICALTCWKISFMYLTGSQPSCLVKSFFFLFKNSILTPFGKKNKKKEKIIKKSSICSFVHNLYNKRMSLTQPPCQYVPFLFKESFCFHLLICRARTTHHKPKPS